jgi:hypothetical protein
MPGATEKANMPVAPVRVEPPQRFEPTAPAEQRITERPAPPVMPSPVTPPLARPAETQQVETYLPREAVRPEQPRLTGTDSSEVKPE